MSDKIQINLYMAGDKVSVSINPKYEEEIRKIAKDIDKRYREHRALYSEESVSSQNILLKMIFDLEIEKFLQKDRNDTQPYTDKIKELTEELENYFKEE